MGFAIERNIPTEYRRYNYDSPLNSDLPLSTPKIDVEVFFDFLDRHEFTINSSKTDFLDKMDRSTTIELFSMKGDMMFGNMLVFRNTSDHTALLSGDWRDVYVRNTPLLIKCNALVLWTILRRTPLHAAKYIGEHIVREKNGKQNRITYRPLWLYKVRNRNGKLIGFVSQAMAQKLN